MNIEIWSVGRENESFIDDGIKHYFNRIKPYANIELILIKPPKKTSTDVEKTKLAEEELILKKLQPHHYLVLLDERGKLLSSPQWAQQMQQLMNMATKSLVLLIGGAHGVSDKIKQQAKQTWSLSNLVFPHQLVRLILAEQVYRAYSIIHNSAYHHE